MLRFVKAGAKAGPAAAAVAAGSLSNASSADIARRPPAQKPFTGPSKDDDGWEILDAIDPREQEEALQLAQKLIENSFAACSSDDSECHLELVPPKRTPNSTPDSEVDDVLILGTGHPACVMEQAEQNMVSRSSLLPRTAPSDVNFLSGQFHRAVASAMMDPECQKAFMKHVDISSIDFDKQDHIMLPIVRPGQLAEPGSIEEQKDAGFEKFCKEVQHHLASAFTVVQVKAHEIIHNVLNFFENIKGAFGPKEKAVKVHMVVGKDGNVKLKLRTRHDANKTAQAAEGKQDRVPGADDVEDDDNKFLNAVMMGTFLVLAIVLLKRFGPIRRAPFA
mmetsp:Transcript_24173/g.29302  ORF Transcript_24173/g.29302 Transcript_24173/m.29302 type:complete len:334 (-) Transcript_24173:371-1372(-)|eukprot:CAMPEP_0197848886 /NCGR_PEP_ID=MMETSP1438-20131217/10372_1 /TAXON_ID=1461541 /ORGANISM="Pterosperma sp., Strain CCMP1384" /LENGTH=333 /DNA_ID=CAMNT_0043461331 /DNA_START=179 /DNA_END=1180 /DNA_ORIENTATION=+